jgi:WD40 repeat protein/serine/threonine protein kinase
MATDSSGKYALLDQVAEEIAARFRHGERPALQEYLDRYPDPADDLCELFPAMVEMEQIREDRWEAGDAGQADTAASLEQLGDFRILREIGRGGMGIVYEAEQISLGRHVALKVLPRKMLLEARAKRRFEREAKAAAKLHHTNIVPVHGVGEHDGLPYYVMQYIQGLGLDEVLEELRRLQRGDVLPGSPPGEPHRRSRPDISAAEIARSLRTGQFQPAPQATVDESPSDRPVEALPRSSSSLVLPGQSDSGAEQLQAKKQTYWQRVAQLGVQVAQALAYAHSQGILHRDIKPSNLLLDTQGTVWITDFGLAKAADSDDLTHTGDIVGTLRYMGPERFQGQADPRSDIYSLGLTLYELLTLRPAFVETDRNQLIHRILHDESPQPRQLQAEIPRDLETIVLKAIAREPAHRYATATDLAEDLKRFLEDRPIHARPASSVERLGRWCRRNPLVASLMSAVFALLAAVAGVATVGYVQTRAAAEDLRRQWYAASISAMQQAWETGQVGRLRALLAETETYPDRGFEWYYCQRLCHLELCTLVGHRAAVTTLSWSPDGKRLVTGSTDGTAKIWDAATGRELCTLQGHTGPVGSVSWSPDGKRLATASDDTLMKVWDATGGQELLTFKSDTKWMTSVSWSPDGQRLATGSGDGTVRVWDAVSGRKPLTVHGHMGRIFSVCWSPDGTQLATGSEDGIAKLWNTAGGQELLKLEGHTSWVTSVSWSPDGKQLATASEDGTAKVWDAAGGREPLTLQGHTTRVWSVSWSPKGKLLATASEDGTAKVWDAASGRELLTFKGHTGPIFSVCWSPKGRRLVTGSEDGTAKVWDAANGREPLTLQGHTGPVISVSWSANGRQLATGGYDRTAKVWETSSGRELLTLKGHTGYILSVSWSPDGQRLATGSYDTTAKVWEAASGRELLTLKGHTIQINSVSWSPDGQRLATASGNGTAKVWEIAGGREPLTLKGRTSWVNSVSWSPDGTRLATGSADGTAKVWQAADGRELLTLKGHTCRGYGVSWSPDGKWLTTADRDGTVKVWEAANGRELLALKGHTSRIVSMAWSPDGKLLATGSWDGTAKVWQLASRRELLTLKGHTGFVWSVSWSPDGKQLATASVDGTAKVWQAADGAAVQEWARQDRAREERLALHAVRGPQAQGFIQTWLLLLPVPWGARESGGQALEYQQLSGEGNQRPKTGERVSLGGQELVWRAHRSPEPVLDFNAVLGQVTERSVAYAACYLECDGLHKDLWLQVTSDDQSKVYLNGKEIYQCYRRGYRGNLDTIPVVLQQGTNVLVFKVVHESGGWQGCVRLVDAAGRPAQGIRVKLTPEP